MYGEILSEIDDLISKIKLTLEKIEGIIDLRLIGIEEPEEVEVVYQKRVALDFKEI